MFHDAAVGHEGHLVGDLPGEAHLVGDHEHRHAVIGQPTHDGQHLADQLRVQRGRRLVEEHELRTHRQCTGDRHTLLLTAGELDRPGVRLVGQTDLVQQLAGVGLRLRLRLTLDLHRGFGDVGEHRAVGEEVEGLEDHSDISALLRGVPLGDLVEPTVLLPVADEVALDLDASGVDLLQVVHAPQQGGLARTGRADEAGHRSGGHVEVDALEHIEGTEALPDVTEGDHRGVCAAHQRFPFLSSSETPGVPGPTIFTLAGGMPSASVMAAS